MYQEGFDKMLQLNVPEEGSFCVLNTDQKEKN